MSGNSATGIEATPERHIGKLVNLTSLNLSYNKLESLPEELSLLVNLKLIGLDSNPILENNKELAKFCEQCDNARVIVQVLLQKIAIPDKYLTPPLSTSGTMT